MGDLSNLFSKLDERYGLLIAGLAFASFVAFLLSLKDGFHLANHALMVAGAFFFIACSSYFWRSRDQSSVSYVGERESITIWRHTRIWTFLAILICLSAASFCAYIACTGGRVFIK